MTRAERTIDGDAVVGVVGSDAELIDRLEAVLADRSADAVAGSLEPVLGRDPSLVVALGQEALEAVARTRPDVPIVPVDAGRGVESAPRDRIDAALEAALDGGAIERTYPLLAVEGAGLGPVRALFDVTVVTAEPARISEYSVESRGRPVARFRADGVVVATPAGSRGYASDAGGPQISRGVNAVSIVPIASFVTRKRRWVVPPEVEITVERDEGDVDLCVDDRTIGGLESRSPVSIAVDGSISVLVPERGAGDFE